MASTSTTASQTAYCKIKRVYPRLPLHVHSAGQKGLAGTATGNPARQSAATSASNWPPDPLRLRSETQLSSAALGRVESVARVRGTSAEDLLSIALAAAS
jgi:hypothetical protein